MYNNILLIGLVNQKYPNSGDTAHFNRLRKYLSEHFEGQVFSISLNDKNTEKKCVYSIKYPNNKFYRFIYWNLSLFIILVYLIIFKKIRFVYFRFSGLIFLPYFFLILIRKPFGLEINGIPGERTPNNKIINKIHKKIFNACSFISGAPGYMKIVKDKFKISPNKIVEVSLGYSFDKIKIYSYEETLKKLKLSGSFLYYIFIGNITYYQGLQYIIDAFSDKKIDLMSKIRILIIGDGPHEEIIREKVNYCGLQDFIHFYPRQHQGMLDYFLSLKSIGLSPFVSERGNIGTISGLKTFDYIFHRMPIITSLMDEKASMIIEDKIGWVIQDFTKAQIIKIFSRSYIEFDKIKKSYDNHYSQYIKNFSWDNRFNKIQKRISFKLQK